MPTHDPATFYDALIARILRDYTHGNRRVESAIKYASSWLYPEIECILDIGCGVGWSTYEFARLCPKARVVGIDLSSGLLQAARKLHAHKNISFAVVNVEQTTISEESSADIAILLDVYEHISEHARPAFHATLNTALKNDASVVLACPTVQHQNYLRKYNPRGLQPIDEDIDEGVLKRLANDLGGHLIDFRIVRPFGGRRSDAGSYIHAVITRGQCPTYPTRTQEPLMSTRERRGRSEEHLGLRVTPTGILMNAQRDAPSLLMATPSRSGAAFTATFIRQQLQHLPFDVHLLYGASFPYLAEDGTRVLPLPRRTVRAFTIARRLLPPVQALAARRLAAWLQQRNFGAVLAQFGMTGAELTEACRLAHVPLIVHFHGFDAYNFKCLARFRTRYKRMFAVASAVISVSREMTAQLESLGCPSNKLHYSPCGVDCVKFQEAEPDRSPPIFLGVGRFVAKKRYDLVIRAFSDVSASVSDARLWLVGDGPMLSTCRELVKELGLSSKVEFHGAQPHARVADMMREVRALVHHSVRTPDGDAEGTPVTILEAGASGLPVIGSRHMGITDVVVEDETGILVDEGDLTGTTQAMHTLAREPALAARMGAAARQRVTAEFSLERQMERLKAIIELAIDN